MRFCSDPGALFTTALGLGLGLGDSHARFPLRLDEHRRPLLGQLLARRLALLFELGLHSCAPCLCLRPDPLRLVAQAGSRGLRLDHEHRPLPGELLARRVARRVTLPFDLRLCRAALRLDVGAESIGFLA